MADEPRQGVPIATLRTKMLISLIGPIKDDLTNMLGSFKAQLGDPVECGEWFTPAWFRQAWVSLADADLLLGIPLADVDHHTFVLTKKVGASDDSPAEDPDASEG